jgi:hypothetical protein
VGSDGQTMERVREGRKNSLFNIRYRYITTPNGFLKDLHVLHFIEFGCLFCLMDYLWHSSLYIDHPSHGSSSLWYAGLIGSY